MQIEIYENYGVLGAEKRSVYTYGNCAGSTEGCFDSAGK